MERLSSICTKRVGLEVFLLRIRLLPTFWAWRIFILEILYSWMCLIPRLPDFQTPQLSAAMLAMEAHLVGSTSVCPPCQPALPHPARGKSH